MIENQLDIIHTTLIQIYGRLKEKKKRFIIMTYEQHNDNFTCSSPNGILQTHRALFLSPGHLFMPIQHSLSFQRGQVWLKLSNVSMFSSGPK